MLNRQKIATLTEAQKQSLRDALDTYDKTNNAQSLCSNVSRLSILFMPTCCGLSVQQQVDWIRYLINYNFKPPQ